MAKIYYNKILNNEMTVDEVPLRWKAEVEAMIRADEITET
ncbi:MAG: CD1375 family protein [Bacillota bacterium]|nr:CD1375 family protein [Bacillota bacterium]